MGNDDEYVYFETDEDQTSRSFVPDPRSLPPFPRNLPRSEESADDPRTPSFVPDPRSFIRGVGRWLISELQLAESRFQGSIDILVSLIDAHRVDRSMPVYVVEYMANELAIYKQSKLELTKEIGRRLELEAAKGTAKATSGIGRGKGKGKIGTDIGTDIGRGKGKCQCNVIGKFKTEYRVIDIGKGKSEVWMKTQSSSGKTTEAVVFRQRWGEDAEDVWS
jgi:hypothetical protein